MLGERKHGKKKRYVKLHFAVDVGSKEIVAMEISTNELHDIKASMVLLEEAGKKRRSNDVLAMVRMTWVWVF